MRVNVQKFYRLFRLRGVPVDFHWSAVLLFAAFVAAIPFFGIPILFIAFGLFSVMLIHEFGHAFLVKRLGYKVHRIQIFPIHGLCLYEAPYSPYEDSLIAWGGVLAQFVLFVPAAATLAFFGNSSVGSVNVLLVTFSYINATIMVTNLTPAAPLDGKKAWKLPIILVRAKWTMYQLKRKKILK
jgi:Zn-dependent protease